MSNFSALNTGLSALIAHRQVVEVTSHNIANVNTEGYSRQRVELRADGQAAVAAVYARGSNVGTGVIAEEIIRIRDEFLENQYRNEKAIGATLEGATAVLNRLEGVFPEPSDSGIASQLGDLWKSWDGVVNAPDSEAARSAVLEKGRMVVDALRLADRQIRTQHTDAVEKVAITVDEVNVLANEMARYNTGIRTALVAGQTPNDLLDERDKVAVRLTELTGATIAQGEHGSLDVFIAGRALVYGARVQELAASETDASDDPVLGPLGFKRAGVTWALDGYPAEITNGTIAGYLSGANEVLPKYLTELNGVASQLVTTVNTLHYAGKGLDDDVRRNFFDPAATTAQTIAVSTDVLGQPRNLAAAAAGAGPLDTSVAEAIARIGQASPGPDTSYRAMIVELGSEVQFFTAQNNVQQGVVQRIDEDRKAVSGVNLDEEMVNLVASQHAYSAAARVITTIDEMLDVLINRMAAR